MLVDDTFTETAEVVFSIIPVYDATITYLDEEEVCYPTLDEAILNRAIHSICLPFSPTMRNLPHELYAWQLQCLNYGYALFEPNPNGAYDFIRVGDVGYVSEDGKFMKLFNAFSDPSSPENLAARLPDNFQPIDTIFRETDRLEPLPPRCRPVEMHDLVFVRECVLTGDWTNISWNSSSCDSDVSFSVGLPGASNVGVSFWGQRQQHVDVPKREGAFRDTPIANEESPVFGQCIFIKGLRIAERAWYDKLACLLKLPLGKGKEEENEPGLRIIGDKDFKITTIGEVGSSIRPIQNAYDAVAIYIFEVLAFL
ncbi:hypothetical protein A7U60_g3226 [Sanghuangporus baumii]|uniref:Uncharacterized protein n=1 Tax=Sanghuangporus baumii TaxID=108892 RepID=A0A9Q5NA36_SANBA|nr:hypothetical protein A7U60_g3226 [Sanghuangporus baumii]